jgi:hypothetical protein
MVDNLKRALKTWFAECAARWWQQIGKSSANCDLCGEPLRPPSGNLIGGSVLECDACADKLLEGAKWKEAIRNLDGYFGPNVPQHIKNIVHGKAHIVRGKDEVVDADEAEFSHEEKRTGMFDSTTTHRHYKASSRAAAIAFLRKQNVTLPLYYIMVETPEGTFGKDLTIMYDAGTGSVIE